MSFFIKSLLYNSHIFLSLGFTPQNINVSIAYNCQVLSRAFINHSKKASINHFALFNLTRTLIYP